MMLSRRPPRNKYCPRRASRAAAVKETNTTLVPTRAVTMICGLSIMTWSRSGPMEWPVQKPKPISNPRRVAIFFPLSLVKCSANSNPSEARALRIPASQMPRMWTPAPIAATAVVADRQQYTLARCVRTGASLQKLQKSQGHFLTISQFTPPRWNLHFHSHIPGKLLKGVRHLCWPFQILLSHSAKHSSVTQNNNLQYDTLDKIK